MSVNHYEEDNYPNKKQSNDNTFYGIDMKYIKRGLGIATGLVVGWNSFVTIGQTERGLDYTFGKMSSKTMEDIRQPGLSFKLPWTHVKKARVDLQHIDLKHLKTNTKDNQQIDMDNTVYYQTPESELITIYTNNPDWEPKLESAVTSSVKSALGRTEADKVAFQRDKIMTDVTKETHNQIKQLLHIDVKEVLMPNYDFDDKYQQAVASASIEKAALNKKATQLQQDSIDAKRKVVIAEGMANAKHIETDANAYATIKQKEAEAEGFDRVQKVIGFQNMSTYLTTSKWNGVGPVAVGTSNFADVSKFAPVLNR